MEAYWYYLGILLILHTSNGQPQASLPTIDRRIYESINGTSACFRLTNATHQIGCSASVSNRYGVLEYIERDCNFSRLLSTGPTPPYIAMLEQECFTMDNLMQLQASNRMKGLVFHSDNTTGHFRDNFSPEKECPNDGYGSSTCSKPWNPFGNNLLGHDFGDLPIISVTSDQFEVMLQCYFDHNANVTTASFEQYPLCSAEVKSDMYAAIDTPTCGRRETLPVGYLSGTNLCSALGDQNIWGTPFQLPNEITTPIIMLTTKLDGVSFFPLSFSVGADAEVAGIVTLLAIIESIGNLQKNQVLIGTTSPIMYTFLNGESWDYIGSSRMVYDMLNDVFPYPKDPENPTTMQPPLIGLSNISTIIELSQLGLDYNNSVYLHGANQDTPLIDSLRQELTLLGLNLSLASGRPSGELPPSSLQRFLRAGINNNTDFEGYVMAGFDDQFNNKFFGSRYDDVHNVVGNSSLQSLSSRLGKLATAVGRTVLTTAGAQCNGTTGCESTLVANETIIEQLLSCFLVNANCSLFRSVTNSPFRQLLPDAPLERYVTVIDTTNVVTSVVFQLAAQYTAFNNPLTTYAECFKLVDPFDQRTNRTAIPVNDTHCYCTESYTYMHRAESPAFVINDLNSREYSTWAESRWNYISITIYLVGHPAVEGGALVAGFVMTLLTLVIAIQCTRRADKLFQSPVSFDPYHVS